MKPSPDDPTPLYDLSVVQKLSRGNVAFMARTRQLIVDTVPVTLAELKQRHAAADWAALGAAAHKLKSTIDTLRIETLKQVVRQIEQDAKQGENLPQLQENIAFVEHILNRVIEQLKAELAGGA